MRKTNNRFVRYVSDHSVYLLLYWPLYALIWFGTENLALGRAYTVHSVIDDMIPFCELFTVFYVIWYPFWIGMMAYCMLAEPKTFRKMAFYFIIGFTAANVIYFLFPTCIDFRPDTFPRENFLTYVTGLIYSIDHPTNVCPSEHVIGAWAVVFTAWDSRRFRSAKWMVPITVIAVLISLSIMFIKQHSFWDLAAAIPFSAVLWLICFRPWKRDMPDA